jgi:hypothetical protein
MFTGISALLETVTAASLKANRSHSSWAFSRRKPVIGKDPGAGLRQHPAWLRTESSNGTTLQGCIATTPNETLLTPIVGSFAALRIGPPPLRERAARLPLTSWVRAGRVVPDTTNPKDGKTLKSTPIGISTKSRGEPPLYWEGCEQHSGFQALDGCPDCCQILAATLRSKTV